MLMKHELAMKNFAFSNASPLKLKNFAYADESYACSKVLPASNFVFLLKNFAYIAKLCPWSEKFCFMMNIDLQLRNYAYIIDFSCVHMHTKSHARTYYAHVHKRL